MITVQCDHDDGASGLFCARCGKVKDREVLRSVRLMGPVGVRHSSSPRIEEFWATGEPDALINKERQAKRTGG